MRWPNLCGRFAMFFGDAVAEGDRDLAEALARVAFGILSAESDPPLGLEELFDYLDLGELAKLEVRDLRLEPPCEVNLGQMANRFLEMLAENGFGDVEESGLPYLQVGSHILN